MIHFFFIVKNLPWQNWHFVRTPLHIYLLNWLFVILLLWKFQLIYTSLTPLSPLPYTIFSLAIQNWGNSSTFKSIEEEGIRDDDDGYICLNGFTSSLWWFQYKCKSLYELCTTPPSARALFHSILVQKTFTHTFGRDVKVPTNYAWLG